MLSQELIEKGFSFANVDTNDMQDYIQVNRLCVKCYVDEYPEELGVWDDKNVVKSFHKKMNHTFFRKLMLGKETAGFLSYDVKPDKIDGISINFIEKSRNHGIGSLFLTHIIKLSHEYNVPIFLCVFKTNPALHLYIRFDFKLSGYRKPICIMRYIPSKRQIGGKL